MRKVEVDPRSLLCTPPREGSIVAAGMELRESLKSEIRRSTPAPPTKTYSKKEMAVRGQPFL